jgi:uncharacterized membrane-anchored protein YitT (DUF2179 family)
MKQGMTPSAAPAAEPHSRIDDAQALLAGSLFVALGLAMYSHVGLLTGGVAGIAFLLRYATGWGFGPIFFVLNLPFYWLALRRLGWDFTLKTFVAISLISAFTAAAPWVISFDKLNPLLAAVLGGFLIGFGALALLRHRASVGGVNILAQYLQQRRGISAGKVQMTVDCSIVAAAFLVIDPWRVALSVLGAVVLSAVLVFNHKPGRYLGV